MSIGKIARELGIGYATAYRILHPRKRVKERERQKRKYRTDPKYREKVREYGREYDRERWERKKIDERVSQAFENIGLLGVLRAYVLLENQEKINYELVEKIGTSFTSG